jgi:hypothetical protein
MPVAPLSETSPTLNKHPVIFKYNGKCMVAADNPVLAVALCGNSNKTVALPIIAHVVSDNTET